MSGSRFITEAWTLVVPAQFVDTLAPLRLMEGVEVGLHGSDVWVRSRNGGSAFSTITAALPASHRYAWLPDDRLLPSGSRLATGSFPAIDWQPLAKWLGVALPSAALPASCESQVPLCLVTSDRPATANALIAGIETWSRWASEAPEVRLKPLHFAASSSGRVLVLGSPLPSLPGRLMVETGGIIIPAGLEWSPAVSAETVREILGIDDQSFVLWEGREVQVLGAELFVPASRSAARATRQTSEEHGHE